MVRGIGTRDLGSTMVAFLSERGRWVDYCSSYLLETRTKMHLCLPLFFVVALELINEHGDRVERVLGVHRRLLVLLLLLHPIN